jgi:hypothetical protein
VYKYGRAHLAKWLIQRLICPVEANVVMLHPMEAAILSYQLKQNSKS